MRIAVVDNDTSWHVELRKIMPIENTEVSYFSSHEEFGKTKLSGYDIIFLEYGLPGLTGEEVAKAIEGKTSAKVALIGKDYNWISKNIVTNGHIQAVLDKCKPAQFKKFIETVEHARTTRGYFSEAMMQLDEVKKAISV